jgi:hypothetical protein
MIIYSSGLVNGIYLLLAIAVSIATIIYFERR